MQLSIDAGTIAHPIPYESYMDESFARDREGRARSRSEPMRARSRLLSLAAGRAADDATLDGRQCLDPPRAAPELGLRGPDGAPLALSSATAARWSILAFGFTSLSRRCARRRCAALAQARKKLGAQAR